MIKRRTPILAAWILFSLTVAIYGQQSSTAIYLYDDNGRLSAIISPNGEAVVYEYDGAGNFVAISRLSSNDLRVITFIPRSGPIGIRVTIYGTGFGGGVTGVAFNGVSAQIISGNSFSVVAEVPPNATTGPISIITPNGSAVSANPFIVRGVNIAPHSITVPANETVPFVATVSGLASTEVTWSVNGVAGGNSSVGTISPDGLYTAPNLVNSSPVQFTIQATSIEDADLFDEGIVTVLSVGAGYQFRADSISVRHGTPVNNQPLYLNDGVSVRYGTPPNAQPVYSNDAVSVRYGTPSNTQPFYANDAVSVRYGIAPDAQPLYANDGVSVLYGTPPSAAPIFVNGAVSVGKGPFLLSLSPGTIARGGSVTLTINGTLLNNASGMAFFRTSNGAVENGISASNINVNGAGTSMTATITVNSSVATGRYVVVIVTPVGATVRSETIENVIQITP
jgi:YD repeat-containing protein